MVLSPLQTRKNSQLDYIHQVPWDTRGAVDFTSVEVWTCRGLVTYYRLFAIELKIRRVHFAGCTLQPDEKST